MRAQLANNATSGWQVILVPENDQEKKTLNDAFSPIKRVAPKAHLSIGPADDVLIILQPRNSTRLVAI